MSNTAGGYPFYPPLRAFPKQSARSVVLPFAAIGAIGALVCSISLFQEVKTDNDQHQKRLATFSIVLGSLYAGVAAMLIFGAVAAATKRLALIRIFSFLSVAVAVIVIASGLMRTVLHFILKDALINECTALATGEDAVRVWGVWNSDPGDTLTADEAAGFCRRAWKHDTFSEIFYLIAELIFVPLFTFIAFGYARQESALASGGARSRLPTNYTPPYAAGPGYAEGSESTATLPDMGYDQRYAPPPGSPPPFDKSLPGYGGGEAEKKDTDSMRTAVAEDPFADFEGPPHY